MLLNAKALADRGYSPWLIQGIKTAGKLWGDNPFRGRYAYEEDIKAWFDRHPDFVASHAIRSKRRRRLAGPRATIACKSGAPA